MSFRGKVRNLLDDNFNVNLKTNSMLTNLKLWDILPPASMMQNDPYKN
jgi:hypothetical protein